jgi:hypothetical protein
MTANLFLSRNTEVTGEKSGEYENFKRDIRNCIWYHRESGF